MEEVVTEAVPTEEQSTILSEEEVAQAVSGEPVEEEVSLPSEEGNFEIPEKFKGKSAEEIAKAYIELEKMKLFKEEEKGGDAKSQEEKSDETKPDEETSKELSEDDTQKYVDEYLQKGELSEESIKALEEAGVTQEQIKEQMEFIQFKQQKALETVLEPLDGGVEKFQEVAAWARENKSEAEVQAFNEALAKSPVEAQRLLLKGLYTEYESSNTDTDITLHSGEKTTVSSKAYSTQEEFFKDVGSPEYQNNPKFRAAVEAKMARSELFQ